MGTLFSLSKSATSIALDASEVVLLLFGVLLTVGLIGEYAKSERWKRHVKTFEMFVIIGVAGELLADGGIFLFSSHLQTIADQEIADLTVTAGKAKDSAESAAKSAKTAHEEADAVKGIADEARKDAKDALAKAQAAQRSLAKAENDAAKAQTASSNAVKKATEVESRIADAVRQANDVSNKIAEANKQIDLMRSLMSARHVTDLQPFIELKPLLKGKDLYVMSHVDEEAREFCLQIADALHGAAEMNFLGGCGSILSGGSGTAVVVTGPEDKKLAKALIKATTEPRVFAQSDDPQHLNTFVVDDKVRVYVGAKTPFWFTNSK